MTGVRVLSYILALELPATSISTCTLLVHSSSIFEPVGFHQSTYMSLFVCTLLSVNMHILCYVLHTLCSREESQVRAICDEMHNSEHMTDERYMI